MEDRNDDQGFTLLTQHLNQSLPIDSTSSISSTSTRSLSPLRSNIKFNKSPTPSTISNQKTSLTGSPSRKTMAQLQSNDLQLLQQEYSSLERQFTDIILKNKQIYHDFNQLESELVSKRNQLKRQDDKLKEYESYIKDIQLDHTKDQELLQQEVLFYKQYIEELQTKMIKSSSSENTQVQEEEQQQDHHDEIISNQSIEKLKRDYRVLESNYEVEKNSRLVLMEQIEFLTKENELLNNQLNDAEQVLEHSILIHHDSIHENSEISQLVHTIHTMNQLTSDEEDEDNYDDDEEEDEVDEDAVNMIFNDNHTVYEKPPPFEELNSLYLAEDIQHSSPIKQDQLQSQSQSQPHPDQTYSTEESVEVSVNFQFPPPISSTVFPPSPDPQSKQKKRQSLPLKVKTTGTSTTSPIFENEEFILSPLKLANSSALESSLTLNDQHHNNHSQRHSPTVKRYSTSKPHHSRYNSHDILPIRVEFEQQPTHESQLRSATVPEQELQQHNGTISRSQSGNIDSILEQDKIRENAFSALNGEFESKRYSLTNSSSKRSSMIVNESDMTRQEIMKLKFELQSLKLHNEKLLSYIGFELQKQKKNIKKLTKKQSAMSLRTKNIEYSDAKLIERSRELLIHKKRVLRSVSINAILSKNYSSGYHQEHQQNQMNGSKGDKSDAIGIGLTPFSKQLFNIHENGEYDQLLNNQNEDDYGFLNHQEKFSQRIFSNGLNSYLNFDDINEIDDFDEHGNINGGNKGHNGNSNNNNKEHNEHGDRNLKKHKSQVFIRKKYSPSTSSSSDEDDDEDDELENNKLKGKDGEWEEITSDSSFSSEEDIASGMFNHIKYLILGANSVSKRKGKKKKDSLVDDGLRYKFITIALGIIIIGVRFSHQTSQQ
ncbi:hypothetical protein DFJ63DRAFT_334504 [Scheffersomyces coipomensis]|uniref:uncharacterized protein n=1 Tax=Scheffersomyces coipomensis TaxID=1788519 RepID=UPI00315DE187